MEDAQSQRISEVQADKEPQAGPGAAPPKSQAWMTAAVAVAAIVPFLGALGFPFLLMWDDELVASRPEFLTFSWSNILRWLNGAYDGQIVPATYLSYMLDYAVAGLSPWAFHLQSVLWHAAACAGVFKCFTLFKVRPGAALVFALAFAVHPQRVESVAWISERKDVMMAALCVWSFYFYAKSSSKDSLFRPASFALFLLALLSKPTAAAMPLVLAGFELGLRPLRPLRQAFRLLPYFAAAAALYVATKKPEAGNATLYSIPMKIFVVAHNLAWYLKTTLLPWDLLPLYPRVSFDAEAIALIAATAILACATAWALWRKGLLFSGALPLGLCFAGALAPTAGLLQFSYADYADRYSYMPSAFVLFAAAWLLSRALDWAEKGLGGDAIRLLTRWPGALLAAAFLAALAASSASYAQTFSSEMALFTVAADAKNPNPAAPGLLALKKAELGIPAAQEFEEAMKALGCWKEPASPASKSQLGGMERTYWYLKAADLSMEQGGAPGAISILKALKNKAPETERTCVSKRNVLTRLSALLLQEGFKDEALLAFGELAALDDSEGRSQESGALFTKGVLAFLKDDFQTAERLFSRAIELNPDSKAMRCNLEEARRRLAETSKKQGSKPSSPPYEN